MGGVGGGGGGAGWKRGPMSMSKCMPTSCLICFLSVHYLFYTLRLTGMGGRFYFVWVGGIGSGGVYNAVNEDCLCGEKCPHCGCVTSSF